MRWLARVALAVGCCLLAVSTGLYIALDRLSSAEQAVAPGEDNFGVAVLAMIYGPPILATGAGGALSLGLAIVAGKWLRSSR